jgi:threonine dehydratase
MAISLAAIEDARRKVAGTALRTPLVRLYSFVDGIGSKTVFTQMLDCARQLIDGVLVADLVEEAAAVCLLAERKRVIADGAGACPVACALSGQAGAGKIACVVSGGNIDGVKLCSILRGGSG